MIDVSNLPNADIPNIEVRPSDRLFDELGNNVYNFEELLAELIDNSIAASNGAQITVEIELGLAEDHSEKSYLIIRDDASGIPRDRLGTAISPAAHAGGSSLNEHGLGMKQAIAALGRLRYLATKTVSEGQAIIVDRFGFGEIFPKLADVAWSHGTEVCIHRLRPIVPTASQSFTKTVVSQLGARYRRFLRGATPRMKLSIRMMDLDDIDICGTPTVLENWNIEPVAPIYFHPNRRKNEPVVKAKSFTGTGWQAELTFGYAPTNDEYKEMELPSPKNYEPYAVSISKQGFDLIRNDRVIKFHQLSEIEIVPARHNDFNYIRGEIDLKVGFTTAITKNNIILNDAFDELRTQLREFLEDGGYLRRRSYPDEIPESLLRDRLANFLHNRAVDPKENVVTEYAVEGLGGFIDLLADGEAWELKVGPAAGLEVYQLFAYMDMANISIGYLISPGFGTGAKAAVDHIGKKHGKKITLAPTSEFPIISPPTTEERKKYY
jgi:hypothetical protein